jgi:exosome complex exonuclease DIS3/RRP44
MVEEMMLLANVAVATAIVAAFPSCSLLRRHQTPGECDGVVMPMHWH